MRIFDRYNIHSFRPSSELFSPLLHCFPTSLFQDGQIDSSYPVVLPKPLHGLKKKMLFAPSTPLSVFYNHVRESKICFFLLFLPPTHIKYFYNTTEIIPTICCQKLNTALVSQKACLELFCFQSFH